MSLKQMFLPKPLRAAHWLVWDIGLAASALNAKVKFALGRPLAVHAYLNRHQIKARPIQYRRDVFSASDGVKLFRFAKYRGSRDILLKEYGVWEQMKAAGFGAIICDDMQLDQESTWTILVSDYLQAVSTEDHPRVMAPILEVLAARAEAVSYPDLPASIGLGLQMANRVLGHSLRKNFVTEEELRATFRSPVRTGLSHRDMNSRNVMQKDGRPVLIDLKKCEKDRVLALDIIGLLCHARSSRHGGSMMREAFDGQKTGWNDDFLQPPQQHIDLPRHLWGPIYALHSMGEHARKYGTTPASGSASFFRRMLNADWSAPR